MFGEYQIVFIFILFIGLLAAGMAVPIAILLPGMLYLYLQGGIGALHGLGITSWGSMDSYTLTSIPLFVLMAEILQGSGLGLRVYRGAQGARRAAADQHRGLRGVRRRQRLQHRHGGLHRPGGAAAAQGARL